MTDPPPTHPTGDDPQVSVIIVAYQARDLTLACLASLFEHTRGVPFEVVLIDNGTDATADAVVEAYPQVVVAPSIGNVGFGPGNNEAARHAKGRYLLLLNPDTLIHDDAITELWRLAEAQPDAGAVGGTTVLPDGRIDPGCQQTGPALRFAVYRLLGLTRLTVGGLAPDATRAGDVPVLSGAFMLVRRDVWDEVGGFDPDFFMYGEETDLCYRIRRAGHRVIMTPNARVLHLVGGGSADSPDRLIAMCKGAMELERKHFGPIHNVIKGLLRWAHSFTRYLGGVALAAVKPGRARTLRRKHAPIALHPAAWWSGWTGHRSGS